MLISAGGNAYGLNKDFITAAKNYTEGIRLNPKFEEFYYMRGDTYFHLGEKSKALSDYNEALRLNPKSAVAYAGRGAVFQSNKKWNEALNDYTQAVQLKSDKADSYRDRADVYAELGELQKAIKDYDETLRLKPNDGSSYCNRGITYSKIREYDKAIADLDIACRLLPKNASCFYNRGFIRKLKGQQEEAALDFREAVRLRPDYEKAQIYLARMLSTSPLAIVRNGRDAVVSATKACELTMWRRGDYVAVLAAAYAEAGDFEQAIKHVKNSMAMGKVDDREQEALKAQLQLYEQHQPYREDSAKRQSVSAKRSSLILDENGPVRLTKE